MRSHTYTLTHLHFHKFTQLYIYIDTYISLSIYIYIYIYIHLYLYLSLAIYIYIYTYIHEHTWAHSLKQSVATRHVLQNLFGWILFVQDKSGSATFFCGRDPSICGAGVLICWSVHLRRPIVLKRCTMIYIASHTRAPPELPRHSPSEQQWSVPPAQSFGLLHIIGLLDGHFWRPPWELQQAQPSVCVETSHRYPSIHSSTLTALVVVVHGQPAAAA